MWERVTAAGQPSGARGGQSSKRAGTLLLSVDFEESWHQLVRRRLGVQDWERAGPALTPGRRDLRPAQRAGREGDVLHPRDAARAHRSPPPEIVAAGPRDRAATATTTCPSAASGELGRRGSAGARETMAAHRLTAGWLPRAGVLDHPLAHLGLRRARERAPPTTQSPRLAADPRPASARAAGPHPLALAGGRTLWVPESAVWHTCARPSRSAARPPGGGVMPDTCAGAARPGRRRRQRRAPCLPSIPTNWTPQPLAPQLAPAPRWGRACARPRASPSARRPGACRAACHAIARRFTPTTYGECHAGAGCGRRPPTTPPTEPGACVREHFRGHAQSFDDLYEERGPWSGCCAPACSAVAGWRCETVAARESPRVLDVRLRLRADRRAGAGRGRRRLPGHRLRRADGQGSFRHVPACSRSPIVRRWPVVGELMDTPLHGPYDNMIGAARISTTSATRTQMVQQMSLYGDGCVVASFPKWSLIKGPVRKVRCGWINRCPIYNYTRCELELDASRAAGFDVEVLSPGAAATWCARGEGGGRALSRGASRRRLDRMAHVGQRGRGPVVAAAAAPSRRSWSAAAPRRGARGGQQVHGYEADHRPRRQLVAAQRAAS